MKYRVLRVVATGQWVDVLFTAAGDGTHANIFITPPESHQTDIARALGKVPSDLEVVDADSDVRVGPRLAMPTPLAPPPTPSEQRKARLRILAAFGEINWTPDQRGEFILTVGKEITG